MASSDAIIIGENWISEHYFTTDAKSQSFTAQVIERRKQWDDSRATGVPSTRSRFTEARASLEAELAAVTAGVDDARLAELYERLLRMLGYRGSGTELERRGPVLRVTAPGLSDTSSVVIVYAKPVESVEDLLEKHASTLIEPFWFDEKTELTSVARTLTTLMISDDGPQFALVLAGRWILIAERERWPEGRYLAINLQLVAERNDDKRAGEIDRALTAVDAQSLLPDAESGEIWWTGVLEESVRHTVGVSQDLRDGVRLSIELIANEVVSRRVTNSLDPLPQEDAQVLATQSLRFLYRILFLLYAEASPELGVLPVGASEFEQGYSLDRLRDLTLVTLNSPAANSGTHIYDSLGRLFHLVDHGHTPPQQTSTFELDVPGKRPDTAERSFAQPVLDEGLTFHSLRADLFQPQATAHIDAVGLGNHAMQKVLRHLLLSKESRGKDRGFISYAELGINQLGAVYEGLMSYTGFFADENLYEVAKNGVPSKGSWVVPVTRADGISPADFVQYEDPDTMESRPVLHQQGTFVYRLAGRERQQSASYYTPEVLTKFVVSQSLAELLDQDDATTPAADILNLTVCEPALGSGAFAIEAVRQLADQYLSRRQKELGTRIDPDEYPRRLQEVKAYIALHQVYGVDLNSTAVELAEISLWLDTMVEGLSAPWFGLHLKRGNSLIGARRAVFTRAQVEQKTHLAGTPTDVPVTELAENLASEKVAGATAGKIHHFLLPSDGWGSAAEAKEAKELTPENMAALKDWRKRIRSKPTKKQLDQLIELSYRVEILWQLAYRRMQIAEQQIRRQIPVWGAENLPVGGQVSREEIEESLADENGAYQRLRLVMDSWTALWFWPLTDHSTQGATPPTLDEWIDACQKILGRHRDAKPAARSHGQVGLARSTSWGELGVIEQNEIGFASTWTVHDVQQAHPWLQVTQAVAARQGFFHWELDFTAIFGRGGFDLQVGNPPWVRPDWDEAAALAEFDIRWALETKIDTARATTFKSETLAREDARNYYLDGLVVTTASREAVSAASRFPLLRGLRPDLYRCFMEQSWRNGSERGIITLIHPETHFTDEKAGLLRAETYSRLRRHWQFINELQLYPEIHHLVSYGVHVYSSLPSAIDFKMATSLYHPDTVERSFAHDGSGPEPGLKDLDGKWDVRPHHNRIIHVDQTVLNTWHKVLEDDAVPIQQSRMVYAVNDATAAVLAKLSLAPRIGALGLEFSQGWNETTDFKAGYFTKAWGASASWNDVILQGPHLFVSTPMYKAPNATMLHNQDWSATDLETLAPDAIPVTSYKPAGNRARYDAAYTHWGGAHTDPARNHYRVAWRNMAANTGERTLISAIFPPGMAHINGVTSLGFADERPGNLALVAGTMSSLLVDFVLRVAPKSTITARTASRLPTVTNHPLSTVIALRSLRLNAVTDAYAALWGASFESDFRNDYWTIPAHGSTVQIGETSSEWNSGVPLRLAVDRRRAQVEIDAAVAVAFEVSADELCTIYRTQFPVLFGYDKREYLYDTNGRLVPYFVASVWRKKGDDITEGERTATNQAGNTYVYELPFVNLDRETDMRQAYAHFETVLRERS
ncbi:class I SAM-dependent DNA methyltransferase [Subtercola sp. RTI3]|uniref:class I SAM-dependent DNA methyltransferase n=1 Tax=Subtercola sp. RTI3 TaxID=3048639 RepID=UPI002B2308BF|nr:class I SAM-dependent DNA methyltransferase [Subtercola sp. RTI3]MEA9986067.1 class I SAM-dependent DNA methyltransferase [Subtercola sp. RTI3]